MDNWQVFLVLSALVGFAISIVTPIVKLTNVMATLSANVKLLNDNQERAQAEHEAIHKQIDSNSERLNEHETVLELHEYRIKQIEATT